MATGLLKGFWKFLNTDVRELPMGEVIKAGAEFSKSTLEAAKAFKEQAPKAQELATIAKDDNIKQFLDVLNSPIAQVVGAGVPFVSIAVTLTKIYLESSKQEPTLTDSVVLVGQIAYLASLEEMLQKSELVKAALGQTSLNLNEIVERQIKHLDTKTLTEAQANKAQVCFHYSELATAFNMPLLEALQDTKLKEAEIQNFVERVAWNTHRYLNQALAEAADKVKPLAELYRTGGQQVVEKYVSLDEYLRDCISPDSTVPAQRDRWRVFDESFMLKDIYIPPQAQKLDRSGDPVKDQEPVDLESWAVALLNDEQKKGQVMFIQGGPGRGKSSFCRMFAERIRQQEYPRWIPILIRLRDLEVLHKNFEETLQKAVGCDFACSDLGWLTDRNTRFLFLLDGFDELLMEGRTSGGLEKFLTQAGKFQRSCSENPEKGHQVLITGRTLSLQSIERYMPENLERIEILPMTNSLQAKWLTNWGKLVRVAPYNLQETLHAPSLPGRVRELAREPLLLYLLAAMHRDGDLQLEMFAGAEGTKAKVLIYEQAITWVLTKQRSDLLNRDLTELDKVSLRRILAEAGLCVVQSGGECTAVTVVENRLQGDTNVKSLLEKARNRLQDNPLRNALVAFYVQPSSSGEGSVEFIHKSFGEFFCAERLKEALEDWSKLGDLRRGGFLVSDEVMNWEIYDLLGYGGLTPEIVEYLMALLAESQAMDAKAWIQLFKRLNHFYERWCEGNFIDASPESLPQKKMRQMKEQLPAHEESLGLRQVDVFAGLNSLILLLELHRYAQLKDDLKEHIIFNPSERINEKEEYSLRLLQVIHYSDCIAESMFAKTIGYFLESTDLSRANLYSADLTKANLYCTNLSNTDLSRANLSGAHLIRANLHSANLSRANLSNAHLIKANLWQADLSSANLHSAKLVGALLLGTNLNSTNLNSANLNNADLFGASLNSTDLRSADLSSADLNYANLMEISWNQQTNWEGVRGLETAKNVPEALKQQLGIDQ
jgi:uncharacterized protein YjbI with pentapeptide repeats